MCKTLGERKANHQLSLYDIHLLHQIKRKKSTCQALFETHQDKHGNCCIVSVTLLVGRRPGTLGTAFKQVSSGLESTYTHTNLYPAHHTPHDPHLIPCTPTTRSGDQRSYHTIKLVLRSRSSQWHFTEGVCHILMLRSASTNKFARVVRNVTHSGQASRTPPQSTSTRCEGVLLCMTGPMPCWCQTNIVTYATATIQITFFFYAG